MTRYLLDTNACIALIRTTEINVRRRFKRAVARESVILLSSLVAFELVMALRRAGGRTVTLNGSRRSLAALSIGLASMKTMRAQRALFALSSRPWVSLSAPTMSYSPARPEDAAQHS